MKQALLFTLLLAGVGQSASGAGYFQAECDEAACKPLSPANSYAVQKAVGVAQAHNAQVGDYIELDQQTPTSPICDYRSWGWTVKSLPVLNSTNLTADEYGYCDSRNN